MSIPKVGAIKAALLDLLQDGRPHLLRELVPVLALLPDKVAVDLAGEGEFDQVLTGRDLVGWRYTLLFSTFGLGAFTGAISMGSWLTPFGRPLMVRAGLGVFAASLGVFALSWSTWTGFPSAFFAGASYFVIVTALVTTLQLRVADEVRGRVMGLWMMAWAGLVPVGGLIGGVVIDLVGLTPVLLAGVAVAVLLAVFVDLSEADRPVRVGSG